MSEVRLENIKTAVAASEAGLGPKDGAESVGRAGAAFRAQEDTPPPLWRSLLSSPPLHASRGDGGVPGVPGSALLGRDGWSSAFGADWLLLIKPLNDFKGKLSVSCC